MVLGLQASMASSMITMQPSPPRLIQALQCPRHEADDGGGRSAAHLYLFLPVSAPSGRVRFLQHFFALVLFTLADLRREKKRKKNEKKKIEKKNVTREKKNSL